jgi:hypothetical protein
MNAIRAKRRLLATYTLGLAAIAFHVAGQRAVAQGIMARAKMAQAISEGASHETLDSLQQASQAGHDRGAQLCLIGFGLAAAGGLSLLLSTVNQEPGWRLPAFGLLLAYVLIGLIQV